MPRFFDRRSVRPAIAKGRRLAVQPTRLGLEPLEARLVLSSAPLDDYDRVTPAWFAAVHDSGAPLAESARWVIRLTPDATAEAGGAAAAAALLADLPISVVRGLGLAGQLLVTSSLDSQVVSQALAASAKIASFQRDSSVAGAQLSNDPQFVGLDQYPLFNVGQNGGVSNADIDADRAWDITTGSANVVTAVIDSGIFYDHPDLAANIWTNSGEAGLLATNGIDDDQNGFVDDFRGWDFANDDNNPVDDHGHGTHVAGTIGAVGNNNVGVAGVNWNTRLMALKFLDANNVGSVSDAVAAINYVTMMRTRATNPVPVRVINASWGGVGVDDPMLKDAIEDAGVQGDILFVAAAGNGDVFGRGQNIDDLPFFPAEFRLDNMLVVTSTDRNDNLATFANVGVATVDIAAPGLSVWSTDLFIDANQPTTPAYGVRSGTSMSAPLAAGTAALAWATAPSASMREVREAILVGGDPKAQLAGLVGSGRRLNAYGALRSLPPQAVVTSAPNITTIGGTTYDFTIQITSNIGIAPASLGNGDFLVRRKDGSGVAIAATLLNAVATPDSPEPDTQNNKWTATYRIVPPDGAWDVSDGGAYEIVMVSGQIADSAGNTSRQKAVGSFNVDLSGLGVYRPTNFTDGGVGSLRWAIDQANAVTPAINPNGGAVILAAGTYVLSLAGAGDDNNATGDLDIAGKVTVASDGSGPVIIQAGGIDRVFDVQQFATLRIDGVTVTGGAAASGAGGGIRNQGTLAVERSTISANTTTARGGGIYNAGTLTVTASTITSNTAMLDGGGVYNEGAGATITASTIDHNSASGDDSQQTLDRVGTPINVNTGKNFFQYMARVAVNDEGEAVVGWITFYPTVPNDGRDQQLFAQRVHANGTLFGPELFLGGVSPLRQNFPDVAIGPDGNFAVAWEQYNGTTLTADKHQWDAVLRTYDANGNVLSTGNLPTVFNGDQYRVDLDVDTNGNYIAAYTDGSFLDGSGFGSYVRRFAPDGTPFSTPVVVPQTTFGHQDLGDVALFENNDGIVVWTNMSLSSTNADIYARFINPQGQPIGNQFLVNTVTAGEQNEANVAASGDGFVVAWRDTTRGVIAQRYNRAGQPLGGEITVVSTADVAYSSVAMLPDGGFAITYSIPRPAGGGAYDIWVRAYNGDGASIGPAVRMNAADRWASFQSRPSIASNAHGDLWVVWDGNETATDLDGIYAQRLSYRALLNGGRGGGVYNASTLTLTNSTLSQNSAAVEGGGVFNALGATSTIASSTLTLNHAAGQQAPLTLTPLGPEFRVNTNIPGSQTRPEVAMNANGHTAYSWTTTFTGSDTLAVRLIGANGLPIGNEVLTGLVPEASSTASIGVSGLGDTILAFTTSGIDGSGLGVDVARVGPTGTVGAPSRATSTNTGNQRTPSVAAAADGSYVVAFTDEAALDGSGLSALVRRYDSTGAPLGPATFIASTSAGNQAAGAIALDAAGIVALIDGAGPGAVDDIFARSFGPTGTPLGVEWRASQSPAGDDVQGLAISANRIVVHWARGGGDNKNGRYVRVFDRAGNPLTNAVQYFNGDPYFGGSLLKADVAMLADDRFAIVWEEPNVDGEFHGIRMQLFDANANLIGARVTVNTTLVGDQREPAIASDGVDTLKVVWRGNGVGDSSGIFSREYKLTFFAGGGVANATGGGVTVKNSIVAENTSALDGPDLAGVFGTGGGNLVGNIGVAVGVNAGTDQVGTIVAPLAPQLGPLAGNGGPTMTHLPAATSPAVDAGIADPALDFDQRGEGRVADGNNNGEVRIDVGAVERNHAAISGRKFKDAPFDENNDGVIDPHEQPNGIQDHGELGIPGWTMYLDLNENGLLDPAEPTAVTNLQGDYTFTQIDPGAYTLAEISPPGWTRTYVSTNYASHVRNGQPDSLGTPVAGLSFAHELAMSPDGKHVYAINTSNSLADSIVTFRRNAATGALEFVAALTNGQTDSLGAVVTGLEGEGHVLVSQDGLHVYALGTADNAIVVFDRNATTGVLTFKQKLVEGDELEGELVEGLADPRDLVISPDGKQIYVVAGTGNTTVGFTRNLTTGLLTVLPARVGGGFSLAVASDGKHVYAASATAITTYSRNLGTGVLTFQSTLSQGGATPGGTADALQDVADIVLSPDGGQLYTLSRTDMSVGVYSRNATSGALSYVGKLTRGVPDSTGKIVGGLQGGKSLAISPSGDRLYATADGDDSVAVFRRNAATGALTFLHVLAEFENDGAGHLMETLSNSDGIAISPDGGSIYIAARESTVTHLRRDGAGLDRKTLLVGQALTDVNLSSVASPGEIRGSVFNDVDNDGVRDADEYGLGGVAVYLDMDGSNSLTSGDVSMTTSVLGEYKFGNLAAPFTYTVRFAGGAGQTVTSPPVSADRERTIALRPDEAVTGANFQVFTQLTGIAGGEISGVVWHDLNGNGTREGNEPFLAGRQVYLDANDNGAYNPGIDLLAAAPTTATGNYFFTGLGATNFAVRVVTSPGEVTTNLLGNSFIKQTLTTGANPLGLLAANFNADTLPDLVSVDGSADRVSVRFAQAGGGFGARQDYAVGSQPTGIAVGRFNGDSLPDIAVVHWALSRVIFLFNQGNGTFLRGGVGTEIPLSSGYTSIATANLNLDAFDDLVVSVDGGADRVHVLRNNSGTNFTEVQLITLGATGPLSIAAGDLTGDGRSEIVVGNFDADTVQVILNSGGTTFTAQAAVAVSDGPAAVTIAPDMNGDGHADVVVANIGSHGVTILTGNGFGGFLSTVEKLVGQGPRAVSVADIDGDGDLDLVVGNSTSNDVVVLRREGPGLNFSFPESSGLASFASLVASGVKQVLVRDLNMDGVVDLAAVRGDSNTGSLAVLYNFEAPGSRRVAITGPSQRIENQDFGITTAGPANPGDYDGDLDADGNDFLVWQRTLGQTGLVPGSGADGNNNGMIDSGDLGVWRPHFGESFATPAMEPELAAAVVAGDDFANHSVGAAAGALPENWFVEKLSLDAEPRVAVDATLERAADVGANAIGATVETLPRSGSTAAERRFAPSRRTLFDVATDDAADADLDAAFDALAADEFAWRDTF